MIRVLNKILSARRAWPASPARVADRRKLPALMRPEGRPARRPRLQVEALEDRCLLAWGAVPPELIPIDVLTGEETVALNKQDDAAIADNEVDYYSFEVPAGTPPTTYVISASTPLSNLDTVLGVYDADGLRLAFNDDISTTDRDSRVSLVLQGGQRYYFGITNFAGTPGGSYTWTVDGPADFYEKNDTIETASDLGTVAEQRTISGLSMTDSADWYRFFTSGAGTSADHVTIEFEHDQGDLQLVLTDAAGSILRESVGDTDNETISLDDLPAGTYFVHVYGASNPNYSLTIDPGPPVVSQLILNGSGSGSGAGTIERDGLGKPVPVVYSFTATVTGKVSILMRAEQEFLLSRLSSVLDVTAAGPPDTKGNLVASQHVGALDHLVQFDVQAGHTYQFTAGVAVPLNPFGSASTGAYRWYISTETADFSGATPHMIPLDRSGLGIQLGTLETSADQDLFAFTATETGRAFVRVDGGGAGTVKELIFDTEQGQTQTFGILVSGDAPGPYVLTVNAFKDDFPDATVKTIVLDPTTGFEQAGRIDYIGDVDVFSFTAPKDGIVTVTMEDDWWRFTGALSVSSSSPDGVSVIYEFTGPANPFLDYPRILQFEVEVEMETVYTVQASGAVSNDPFAGHSANYVLSLSMVEDDFAETSECAYGIVPDESTGAGIQSGSIEKPEDQDRFKFTARENGYVIVALSSEQATNMQGRLTFPTDANPPNSIADVTVEYVTGAFSPITTVGPDGVFSNVGYDGTTRDHFVVIQVEKCQTYEFLVSADDRTIGDYTLALTEFYSAGTSQPFKRLEFSGSRFVEDTLTFTIPAAPDTPVLLTISTFGFVFPAPETGNPSATNTQLAAFPLPPTNTGGTPGAVTVPSGQATLAGNSLINTLLVVAARDNAVRPTESVVASTGTTDIAATLFAALLTGVIAPGTGGTDAGAAPPIGDTVNNPNAGAAPPISGTVFEDLDGNGRLDQGEPGLAGEKIVLEVQQNGQYVVVATALTDAKGAYSFAEVPAGEYRVRRLAQVNPGSNPAASTSYPVKVTGESKPKTLDFGKPGKRGKVLVPRAHPGGPVAVEDVVHIPESPFAEEIDRAFQDWNQDDSLLDLHAAREGNRGAADSWLGLLAVVPAVMLTIDNRSRDRSANEVWTNADNGRTRPMWFWHS